MLENICRLAAAGTANLAILVKLCMASELPTIAAICEANEQAAKQAAKQQQSQLPSMGPHASSTLASINSPAAKCLIETIRKLCSQSGKHAEQWGFFPNNLVVSSSIVGITFKLCVCVHACVRLEQHSRMRSVLRPTMRFFMHSSCVDRSISCSSA